MPFSNVLSIEGARNPIIATPDLVDRAREADHRIANNLALIAGVIRLQAAGATKQTAGFSANEVKLLLAGVAARIDAIGQLHRTLSLAPKAVTADLGEHLQNMCSAMQPFVAFTGPVQLCCDPVPDCLVAAEDIVPIALIVSEMVTNSIKYAHPTGIAGRIDVGCYRDGKHLVVEVTDNGVGLPENLDVERGGGLGFKVVRTLAKQLDATLVFDSDMLGLRFLLLLPDRIRRSQ